MFKVNVTEEKVSSILTGMFDFNVRAVVPTTMGRVILLIPKEGYTALLQVSQIPGCLAPGSYYAEGVSCPPAAVRCLLWVAAVMLAPVEPPEINRYNVKLYVYKWHLATVIKILVRFSLRLEISGNTLYLERGNKIYALLHKSTLPHGSWWTWSPVPVNTGWRVERPDGESWLIAGMDAFSKREYDTLIGILSGPCRQVPKDLVARLRAARKA